MVVIKRQTFFFPGDPVEDDHLLGLAVAALGPLQGEPGDRVGQRVGERLADRLGDPWLILPVVFGLLITAYVDLAFATSRTKRIAIWLTALPALTATGALLAASADIYLITSATLLVVQRLWVSGQFAIAKVEPKMKLVEFRVAPDALLDELEFARVNVFVNAKAPELLPRSIPSSCRRRKSYPNFTLWRPIYFAALPPKFFEWCT